MSRYEQQLQQSERHYDRMMQEIKAMDPDILYSVVPGSQLHQKIHNPASEGTDED